MSKELWTTVDQYLSHLFIAPDPALDAALADSAAAGLPPINVAPNQGKLLHLLARLTRATRILEIGTLGAYSTLWLARALPPTGHLLTLEADPKHATVARNNIARAHLSHLIELREGKALETLPTLLAQKPTPYDLTFIDADKTSCAEYFDYAVRLSHPGSVIVVDNVIRNGNVTDPASTDVNVLGVRRFLQSLSTDKRVTPTALQTVGAKGYDGFALAIVN